MKWKMLGDEEARAIWDQNLARFPNGSPFQSYAWGEYRRGLGWQAYRWAAFDDRNQLVAMMQAAVRRYPLGIALVWCEGGPVGDLTCCDGSLQSVIRETTGATRIYCRFRCDRARSTVDCLQLSAQGWSLPWAQLTTSYSMTLDLTLGEDRLLAACDRNWRRNLRRSEECNLSVRQWLDPSVDEVLSVYTSMQDSKGLEEQLSRDEIEQLLRNLKPQLVLYRCADEQGAVVSVLGCLVIGDRSGAVFWATSQRGRELHASYAAFWAIVQHCCRLGLASFDLAGIDPVRNRGVYRFKKATGATPIEYLGEWDWATSTWLRWFGNWAIARRNHLTWARPVPKGTVDAATPLRASVAGARASLL